LEFWERARAPLSFARPIAKFEKYLQTVFILKLFFLKQGGGRPQFSWDVPF